MSRHRPRAAACLLALASSALAAHAASIPVEFRHDRVFVVAKAPAGLGLTFFTDTGGGWNAITTSAASRLGLGTIGTIPNEQVAGGRPFTLVPFPVVVEEAGVPRPRNERRLKGGLVVVPDGQVPADGMLGSRWFADRIWEIDYGARSLKLLERAPTIDPTHRVDLGFRDGADGKRDLNFPRVAVVIDGQAIDMLLDTGATATLTESAAKLVGLPTGTQAATGFITASIFAQWTAAHPDWRVVAEGDAIAGRLVPMIEVPRVSVAGHAVGPVWFAQRPDADFRDFMSSMTDRPVDGALGGSALRYFRVTIDYPAAAAWFEPLRATP